MVNKDKIVDPEIEKIKGQLKAIGIMAGIFVVIFPFQLGFILNFLIVTIGTMAVTYWMLKRNDAKKQLIKDAIK